MNWDDEYFDTADWRAREALMSLWSALREMPPAERRAFLVKSAWLPGIDVDAMLEEMARDEGRDAALEQQP